MTTHLSFLEADPVLKSYYDTILSDMHDAFEHIQQIKRCSNIEGYSHSMSPRSMGSIYQDFIRGRMTYTYQDDLNVRVGMFGTVFGILIKEKIFIRFNKMNESLATSVARTKQCQKYLRQGEVISGLPPEVTRLWAGYVPDKTWSEVKRNVLVCFNDGLDWYYHMDAGKSVQQLSIYKPTIDEQTVQKRRVSLKKRKDSSETGQTGTDPINT